MSAQDYAEAILKASHGKSEEELEGIVQRTIVLLEKKGHRSLLPNIVREMEKLDRRGLHTKECLIKVSEEGGEVSHTQSIEESIQSINAQNLSRRVEVDSSLIGGYEIRAHGKRIDKTYKRTLLHLYNTLLTK